MAPGSRCAMSPSVGSASLPHLSQCHRLQTRSQASESWPEAHLSTSPPFPPAPFIISWYSYVCPLLFKGLNYFHLHKLVKTNLLPYYPLNWFRSDLLSPPTFLVSPQPKATLNRNPDTTCAPTTKYPLPFPKLPELGFTCTASIFPVSSGFNVDLRSFILCSILLNRKQG